MNIDWAVFTPWQSLAGGILIGLAATLLLLINGRVLGVSGIVSAVWRAQGKERHWRLAFLFGLLLAPSLYLLMGEALPAVAERNIAVVLAGGLLVGLGTRYASGCTSGHGVCGVARLAPRSFVATGVFMAAGFLTVYVLRHL